MSNTFELLYSAAELSDTFYTSKIFKDMKFVTHSSVVFKAFISDFKASISSRGKLDGLILKYKILDSKVLLGMLFLPDLNCLMARVSETVQTWSNRPWDY